MSAGPLVWPENVGAELGIMYSVTTPAVVIRPILFPPESVNQSAPSGPVVRRPGVAGAGSVYFATTVPSRVMRLRLEKSGGPISGGRAATVIHKLPSGPAAIPRK